MNTFSLRMTFIFLAKYPITIKSNDSFCCPKSPFQMKVIFHYILEIKDPEEESQSPKPKRSRFKFPLSGIVSSPYASPQCLLKYRVKAAVCQEVLEHFLLPSVEKLYREVDFSFQYDVAPAHTTLPAVNSSENFHGKFCYV